MRSNLYLYTSGMLYTFGGMSAEQKAQLQQRADRVKPYLQQAADENRKLTLKQVADETNNTVNEMRTLLKNYSDISALWGLVNGHKRTNGTKEEREQWKKDIEKVLTEAKNNNERLSAEEVASRAGVTFATAKYYLLSDDKLNGLWFWVKKHETSYHTKDEMQEQTKLIEEQMRLAIEQKKAITLEEISNETGIPDRSTVDRRISADKTLSALKKDIDAIAEQNLILENIRIKSVIQDAQARGIKITKAYISKQTSITLSIVRERIKQNKELHDLFELVKAREYNQYSEEQVADQMKKINSVLTAAKKAGQKMTLEELSAKVDGVHVKTLETRIKGDTDLSTLWSEVRKSEERDLDTKEEMEAQSKKIENILFDIRSKNKKISTAELVSLTNLTEAKVLARINASDILRPLWAITCSRPGHKYSEEEIKVHNVMIERILRQRIQDKMIPAIYQMSQYLDLTAKTIKERIKSNAMLSALFNQAQNPEDPTLAPPPPEIPDLITPPPPSSSQKLTS